MAEKSSNRGGVGFLGLLQVAFVVLKLCGVIGWSWWWVLAPMWIPLGVGLFVCLLMLPVAILMAYLEE